MTAPQIGHRRPAGLWLSSLLLLAAGCGRSGPATGAAAKAPGDRGGLRLGAVLPTFGHPFFLAQKAGLEDEAKAQGVAIDVRDGKDDDRRQTEQVETLVRLRPDALLLCPRDADALVRAVETANRAGVPVVTFNRQVRGGQVVSYVGADDAAAGRAQAEALIAALGPKGGAILYLEGTQGSSPQRRRAAGFREALKGHPEIAIADSRFADFQADRAKAVMTALARRFRPGQVRGLVAQNDEMALPAAEVARAAGWRDVVVIGCDGTSAAFAAIRSGLLHATVLQDAADQGRRAVRAAVDHLSGRPVPPEILTPLPVVTKLNVDQLRPSY